MSDIGVYKSINAVQADLAKIGISKDSKNTMQGYNFRGIDAVYNALSPLLAQHNLCILPRVLERECVERVTAKGGAIFYVTVKVEFDFVSALDGSKHTIGTYGEAMDSADKATNKAMSAAYKYAAFQAFAIPTEGDNDADAHNHELKPKVIKPSPAPNLVQPPLENDELKQALIAIAETSDLDTLKGIYGGAYKRANDAQKIQLVDTYNLQKSFLQEAA